MTSIAAYRKARIYIQHSRYILAVIFILIAISAILLSVSEGNKSSYAGFSVTQQDPNVPIGEAKGIFPGRVVWVHDSAATNEKIVQLTIRKQKSKPLTKEMLLEKTINEYGDALLEFLIKNGASSAFFGGTNTGKTGTMASYMIPWRDCLTS